MGAALHETTPAACLRVDLTVFEANCICHFQKSALSLKKKLQNATCCSSLFLFLFLFSLLSASFLRVSRVRLSAVGALSLRMESTVFKRLKVITIPYQQLFMQSVDEAQSLHSNLYKHSFFLLRALADLDCVKISSCNSNA